MQPVTAPGSTDRAWVDVDLAALTANARVVAQRVARPLLPMVKANGYGLGAVPVAHALAALQPWGLGVATPAEALELRAAGIGGRIVCFTPLLPQWIPAVRAAEAQPAIGDPVALKAWVSAGGGPWQLEIDTGMSRGGIRWDDAAALSAVTPMLNDCAGIFSHCHSAEQDAEAVAVQHRRLQAVVAALPVRPPVVHLANSAVALNAPALAGDLARPGIFLYGGGAFGVGGAERPQPVATLQARIVALRTVSRGETVSYGATWTATRPTRVATLAIGYGDGLLRSLSNRGTAAVQGRVCPIIGRVTMDMTMLAIPDDLGVEPGEIATLFGGPIGLEGQAAAAGTISYELLTSLGTRLPRRYTGI